MKLFIRFSLVINISLLCSNFSCAQKISGFITNSGNHDVVKFTYFKGLITQYDSTNVKSDGSFSKSLRLDVGTYINFQYKKLFKRIYLFPNSSIKIRFDALNSTAFNSSFRITGDHHINAYLDSLDKNSYYHNYLNKRINLALPIDSLSNILYYFRPYADSLRNAFFVNEHDRKNTEPLRIFLRTDSINAYFFSVMIAIDYMRIIPKGNKDQFWENEVVNKISYTSPDHLLSAESFKVVLRFYLQRLYERKLQGADSATYKEMGISNFYLEFIQLNKIGGSLKEYLVSQILYNILYEYTYLPNLRQNSNDTLITKIGNHSNNKVFLKHFYQLYQEAKKNALNQLQGKRAPNFLLVDSSGNVYQLDNFKGKVVLLDLWASWCGPCIKEFPDLRKLQIRLKDRKDFQLLSVSSDDTKELWLKSGVGKYDPPGFALWEGKEKEFSKSYGIRQIPTLVLLDRSGNLIEFNPPKASEGNELYNLILKNLKELPQ